MLTQNFQSQKGFLTKLIIRKTSDRKASLQGSFSELPVTEKHPYKALYQNFQFQIGLLTKLLIRISSHRKASSQASLSTFPVTDRLLAKLLIRISNDRGFEVSRSWNGSTLWCAREHAL